MKALPRIVSVTTLLVGLLTFRVGADPGGVGSARLQLVEATVSQLEKALQTKLLTTEELVGLYLARIAAYLRRTRTKLPPWSDLEKKSAAIRRQIIASQ